MRNGNDELFSLLRLGGNEKLEDGMRKDDRFELVCRFFPSIKH